MRGIRACFLAYHSGCIVAIPYLHRTLVTPMSTQSAIPHGPFLYLMLETITPTHLIWLFFLVRPPEEVERNLFVSPSVSVQTNRMSKRGKSEVDARLANQRVAWHALQSNVFSTVKDSTIGCWHRNSLPHWDIDRRPEERRTDGVRRSQ